MIYKKFVINKIYNNNFNNYNSKYIIKINNDVLDFADSIKEAKFKINNFIKEK